MDALEAMKNKGNALFQQKLYEEALAMEDAVTMERLESANPSVGPLIERLQLLIQDEEEDLVPKMRDCTVNGNATSDGAAVANNGGILNEKAEKVWRLLQADEMELQEVHHLTAKRSSITQRKPSEAQKAALQPMKVGANVTLFFEGDTAAGPE
ncbi:hypothetical protein BBO99_00001674 [Phytophthora kernoviae]|uniref:Uncharacterized protein n=2 Tax=Phytophthora kernoviae TaxID=325452 RepID=A0A3R7G632_9STRA|nr:hypothetical protein G195_005062 [Phytophthora kernoviae 00238/432]KAG2525751.1 hypothetical protein JM16_003997 [Phytophthora kernoviae]KAG2527340.1 hypothetical protein JM18_003809 [Phytophthora kernoviae]RLN31872.1 hypothetical protein BBI17_000475 [Phytophthora kernoviae]RLN83928.1 hypothetical protein BBO99_00001674 [Phytophthora kernoviae]